MNDCQISLEIPSSIESDNFFISDKDGFDLCDAFRSCSAAMCCIYPQGVDYINCRYAKKLKQGICFYGKNSSQFDLKGYKKFCTAAKTLPSESKTSFEHFVRTYFETRCDINQRFDYSDSYKIIADVGLITIGESAHITLNRMKSEELKQIIKINFSSEERKVLNIKLNATNKELRDFILNNCPNVIKELNNKYVYVSIIREFYLFYIEYYYDFLNNDQIEV